ncbi:hypothetical protein [Candidatus Phytoplasma pini]|uniref:Uncharacterized protein n=1 Tax=Candidatus Phytoplasma pini TaxID=267362 RepID=A0A559KJF9_9MOLU|nr:hypothetical protein [Candidatus Phytoplasma pini]TVY12247.1 hypothetical protein MDPP_00255 [Candidatus Phytoplasma pini]
MKELLKPIISFIIGAFITLVISFYFMNHSHLKEHINLKSDHLKDNITQIDKKLDELKENFNKLDAKIDKLDNKIDAKIDKLIAIIMHQKS